MHLQLPYLPDPLAALPPSPDGEAYAIRHARRSFAAYLGRAAAYAAALRHSPGGLEGGAHPGGYDRAIAIHALQAAACWRRLLAQAKAAEAGR